MVPVVSNPLMRSVSMYSNCQLSNTPSKGLRKINAPVLGASDTSFLNFFGACCSSCSESETGKAPGIGGIGIGFRCLRFLLFGMVLASLICLFEDDKGSILLTCIESDVVWRGWLCWVVEVVEVVAQWIGGVRNRNIN